MKRALNQTEQVEKEVEEVEEAGVADELVEALFKQITVGCGYPDCENSFCRSSYNFSLSFTLFLSLSPPPHYHLL